MWLQPTAFLASWPALRVLLGRAAADYHCGSLVDLMVLPMAEERGHFRRKPLAGRCLPHDHPFLQPSQ